MYLKNGTGRLWKWTGIFFAASLTAEKYRVSRVDFLHESKKKAYVPMASATLISSRMALCTSAMS